MLKEYIFDVINYVRTQHYFHHNGNVILIQINYYPYETSVLIVICVWKLMDLSIAKSANMK